MRSTPVRHARGRGRDAARGMLAAHLTEGPMTILDPAGATRRIRIDAAQLADELARRLPDTDQIDLARAREAAGGAVHDAAAMARVSLDRAAGRARTLGGDVVHAGERAQADLPFDELGQRIRSLASTDALRALVARLERELPGTDRDRYDRAYARGRVQARSIYLALGIAAGVTLGVAAAALLEPGHGKERRELIARRASALVSGLRSRAAATARTARDRTGTGAQERGPGSPDAGLSAPGIEVVEPTGGPSPAIGAPGTTDVPPVTLPEGAVPVMAGATPGRPEDAAAPSAEA